MPSVRRPAWPIIAGLMIFLVLLSGFVPAIFAATNGTNVETVDLDEGETIKLNPPLEATLVDVSQGQMNVTLIDTETGDKTQTGPLNVSESATVTIRGNSVTVTYTEDIGNNAAIITFEYPVFYEWGQITIGFVGTIGLIIILLFLYIIFMVFIEEDE